MEFFVENIPIISQETNFWLVRTQKGFFYEQFVSQGYIALGWNWLGRSNIVPNMGKEKKEEIKGFIKDKYPKITQPGRILNKCMDFIYSIQSGDIIVIPGPKNRTITFAIAGEYYEEDAKTHEKEEEALQQIVQGYNEHLFIECPYKKRRKITILETICGEFINPNIYKALLTPHGIAQINEVSEAVLSSIYDIYYYNNKLTSVFRVRKEGRLNPIDVSSLMYNFTYIVSKDDKCEVSTKVNLNSPGDMILEIINQNPELINGLSNIKDFIAEHWQILAIIWFAACGGEIFGCKFNSVISVMAASRESRSRIKNEKLDRKLKKIAIDKEKLLYKKLKREHRKEGIKDITENLKHIKKAASNLRVDSSKVEKIINFKEFKNRKSKY